MFCWKVDTELEMNLKDTECNEHIDTCQSMICMTYVIDVNNNDENT